MALFGLWSFVWDDVLDSGDHGDHTSPSETVRPFEQALVYAEHHLGLSNPPNEPPAPSAAFGLLQHSARTLREQVNADQRLRIFNQIKIYIECCQTEQKYTSRGVVPSEQEYWEYRRDTSTIPMWLSLAEYAADVTLPRVILETDEFSTLWKQVNRGGIIINDVLSLRKEMHENVINLVPVMMHASGQSIDSVMSLIIQQLEKCVQDIKGAGRALLGMVDNDPLLRAGLQRYIDQVESMVTGAYYWSLECDRYQVAQYKQEDGSLVIPLKCAPHQ
ncbi:hypothetical protein CDD82_7674 [Ophiocordyceps australis]|uniref:Terpene synthase n=1 Tax=Ophiocordyceps australis TaxID=1399860 RepID=A0A2C5YJ70_9HYPO|nr:hypothetical protein CDD82_7674 [Ophiocordyceps australis]